MTSCVDYCNAVLAGSPKVTTDKLQRVMNSAARVVTTLGSSIAACCCYCTTNSTGSMSPTEYNSSSPCWCTDAVMNCSAVHDRKLHTNSRRRQSSTPAVRQSAEDDRSAVSNGQLWYRRSFAVAGPSTWNSLPDSLRDPALSLSIFQASPEKKTLFAKY